MDKIKIKRIKIFAHHGVFEEENINGQNFYVSLTLYVDTRVAGMKDRLELSTHYGEVSEYVNKIVKEKQFKLIESVAENIASEVLINFPLIKKIKVRVSKPEAPIPLEFEDVCVEIKRGWEKAYIAIGSNLGDSARLIEDAIDRMKRDRNIKNLRSSTIIRTKPYGGVEQEDFLNGVLEIDTLYTPHELLTSVQAIENELGRVRTIRWGARTMDLDILLYGDSIIRTQNLIIPHYDMVNRDFVLRPLAEIAPYTICPTTNITIKEMYDRLKNSME